MYALYLNEKIMSDPLSHENKQVPLNLYCQSYSRRGNLT